MNFLSALHAVYGILVDMHRLYGLSPPPNPYSPQGRPAGFDPAVQFVADTLCPDSVSQKVLTLSTGRQIVEVGCEMAAYQGMFRYAWRDGSGPVLDERGQPLALVGLPDFDLRADALISLEKARGVGGCGEWYRLSLQGDRFVEIEHRSRRCSESELVIDPRKWAVVPKGRPSHCSAAEETLFSCDTSRTHHVSLCASEGRVQYRAGRRGNPDVVHPPDGRASAFDFREEEEVRHIEIRVSFEHRGRRHQLAYVAGLDISYTKGDRAYESLGVTVSSKGERPTEMGCQGAFVAHWDRMKQLLGGPADED